MPKSYSKLSPSRAHFDEDELIDGQHRLKAVVLSGKTVHMMVSFGFPSQINGHEMTVMDTVDRGRTRSVSDQLVIQHGFKNGSITAAICASLGNICCGKRTKRLSVGETLDIFRAFEKPILWLIDRRSKEHGLKAAGVLAGFAFALASDEKFEKDPEKSPIACMYNQLVGGENLKKNTAIDRLRQFLTSDEAKLLTRGSDRGLAEIVLQAIYLEKGKPISKLEVAQDGVNHFRAIQEKRVANIAQMFQAEEVK